MSGGAGPTHDDVARLLAGEHEDPHRILGAHLVDVGTNPAVVVRALHPDAVGCELLRPGATAQAMHIVRPGLFETAVARATIPMAYRLRFQFRDGSVWERDDPYRFLPTLGDVDLHLFNEGTHTRLWEKMGSHERVVDGVKGTSFAVWAPNARRVSLVGDFCQWDGRLLPMRLLGSSGVFELFVPAVSEGTLYKFEVLPRDGAPFLKSDPFSFKMEQWPGTASIVVGASRHAWRDDAWIADRAKRDLAREPMLVYEVHLGSWARVAEERNRPLSYREIAGPLSEHAVALGCTHIELMPVAEHPYAGSWGYQVTGYYAPTSRYGSADDFRYFVDTCHGRGLGVIVDWVPAHFPKDDFALRRFDGTALYEHEDPRLGEHPDWGTLIFNYGRREVAGFLLANALYWLREFHIDGLRVDAVASMLYLDYSRAAGEWLRNQYGGRENLDAIEFLRQVNTAVHAEQLGCFTVAEESTAWPGVTRPVAEGGLGFAFKWNMGWMHDTLEYFSREPIHRRFHQDQLTFAMMYEYSEHFIMPLSHDEVVHLKRSLLDKMPGDEWQRFANLRTLLAYQYTRPGKKLIFMGTELAPWNEWSHEKSLDWHLVELPSHGAFVEFTHALGSFYRGHPALWHDDPDPTAFSWIDIADRDNSVLSYVRRAGDEELVVILNLTPVVREQYRVGAPRAGRYVELLNTDDERFGGSGQWHVAALDTEPAAFHGYPQSMVLNLPPLAVVVLSRHASPASVRP